MPKRKPEAGPTGPQKIELEADPAFAGTSGFYADQFKQAELERIRAAGEAIKVLSQPGLVDEIWMQRVVNRRLLEHATRLDPDEITSETLADIVRALAVGTTAVARLLRAHKELTGGVNAQLEVAVRQAIEELQQEHGWAPQEMG